MDGIAKCTTYVNSISLKVDHISYLQALLCYCRYFSDSAFFIAFFIAALCFSSKLMTYLLIENTDVFWVQLGPNFSSSKPFFFKQNAPKICCTNQGCISLQGWRLALNKHVGCCTLFISQQSDIVNHVFMHHHSCTYYDKLQCVRSDFHSGKHAKTHKECGGVISELDLYMLVN